MGDPDHLNSKNTAVSPAVMTPTPTAPPDGNLEDQPSGMGSGASVIVRRWRRGDLLKKGSLTLRGLALLFSLLAFIIMATNKHGDGKDFDKYEEYRYVLAIAILSSLYTGAQILRQVHELSSGKQSFSGRNLLLINFIGDQIVAYLLISAASSAVPMTNRLREGADNIFTDSSASAISMEFLAFLALALSSLLSGQELSNQSYI